MSKSVALLLVLILVTSVNATFLSVKAESRTIVVPDDHQTIASAVGNATEGTTIYIKKGDYELTEKALVINKTLTIIGEDQANTKLIGPTDTRKGYELLATRIAFRINADNFEISNLTITNSDYGVYINGNGTRVNNVSTSSIYTNGSQNSVSGCNVTLPSAIPNTLTTIGSLNLIQNNHITSISCTGSFNKVAENSGVGLSIAGNSNAVVKNTVTFIDLSDSNSNVVFNNSVSNIEVRSSYNNTVIGNTVKGNTVWGILMGSGSGNVFCSNYISDFDNVFISNGRRYGYGVAIGGYGNLAENNLFYRNNFVNNYKDVSANWPILGAGNLWDNGTYGNYWDDYSGVDSDNDGIGDVEYSIRGQKWDPDIDAHVETVFGQDLYPLMDPFDISTVAVELPNWTSQLPNPSQYSQGSEPEPSEPFPVLPVAAIVIAAVTTGAGLLVYFKKRNRDKTTTTIK